MKSEHKASIPKQPSRAQGSKIKFQPGQSNKLAEIMPSKQDHLRQQEVIALSENPVGKQKWKDKIRNLIPRSQVSEQK